MAWRLIKMQSEPNITVRVDYYGQMVDMQVVPNESKFGILYRDFLIAEISNNEDWEQVSGEKLPRNTFDAIVDKIIIFYE